MTDHNIHTPTRTGRTAATPPRLVVLLLLLGMYSFQNSLFSQPLQQLVSLSSLHELAFSLPSSLVLSLNIGTTEFSMTIGTSVLSANSTGATTTADTTYDSEGSSFNLSVSSYVQCRLQMELYLYIVMTDWLQQDIPMLLNSYYLQPHATVLGTTMTTTMHQSPVTSNTHYHHLHFYYKALEPKEYKKWQQEGTWTCHYEYDNNTTIDHHRQEKKDEALPARLELFRKAKGREMMVICPSQPPPPPPQRQQQQQQQQRLLQKQSSL
jgi:hypothetical protein